MSAGLSTTITITFTPQLNEDINSFFPILSETGRINIPLICTCKKALIEVENPAINFGDVIFGESNTQYLKIKNNGALPTKIYINSNDGRSIPFVSLEDIKLREQQKEEADKPAGETEANEEANEDAGSVIKSANEATQEDAQDIKSQSALSQHRLDQRSVMQSETVSMIGSKAADREPTQAEIFDEFLAQVSFKRCTDIEGYSQTRI